MKITTFNPTILTKKPEEVIALFEALGFERRHHKVGETVDVETEAGDLQFKILEVERVKEVD